MNPAYLFVLRNNAFPCRLGPGKGRAAFPRQRRVSRRAPALVRTPDSKSAAGGEHVPPAGADGAKPKK